MECAQIIDKTLKELKIGFKCIPYDRGLGIVTPYLYPDNDLIEIYVEELTGKRIRVTDLGETLRHLVSQGIDVLSSSKRKFMLEQISKRLHVQVVEGRLEKEGAVADVGNMLLDVAAAANSVAGLVFTSKAYEPAEFPEEVSGYLKSKEIEHETNVKVVGETGRNYHINIRINHQVKPEILVETMSPSQQGVMSSVVNKVVREWVDIDGERRKVSLLNDIDFHWHITDILLLEKYSMVHRWSEKDAFIDYIVKSRG